MSALAWIGVGLLGGAGALARFLVDGLVSERAPGEFPWGTFVVNVSGALALGLLSGLALRGDALILLGTATLGSYTTFSTWMLESHRSAEESEIGLAVLNIVVSLAAGLGAVALGRTVGGWP